MLKCLRMVMMKGLTGDRWKNVRDSFERFGIFLYDSIGQKMVGEPKLGTVSACC